jgi:tetratricopeptide (TPR) repeat protein
VKHLRLLLACAAALFGATPLLAQEDSAATALVSTVQRENEWFCSISAPRTSLRGIVEQLARGILVEVEGLERISPTALVTVELRDRPVPQALEWVLGAANLRAKWRTGVLQIQPIVPHSPTPDELRDCALATYTGALRSFPDVEAGARAAFAKALIFEQRGSITQAVSAYDSLVRAFPEAAQAPEALIRAARRLFAERDYEGAGLRYADLLRLSLNSPFTLEARLGFAKSLAFKGDFRTALRLLSALDTSNPAATRKELHERLLVRARCVLGEGNAPGARALLREAENGGIEPELELDYYELSARALPLDAPPEYAATVWLRYAQLADGDRRVEAAAEATRLTRLAGDELAALWIDRWAEQNGAGAKTRTHANAAREALGLDPSTLASDPVADRLARAERLMRARLWAEAQAAFETLRASDSALDDAARTRVLVGLALCLDGQDAVDQAIEVLREGLAQMTDEARRRDLLLTAGSIFEDRERIDEAIEAYRGKL